MITNLSVSDARKVFFLSDLHLGAIAKHSSEEREQILVKWLQKIKDETEAIFFLGDIFDFWYEWKRVVPKGFIRFLGKIAEFTDAGTAVYFFTGNHDLWMFNYLEKELNVNVCRKPTKFNINNKKFYLGHGDGLGPGDKKYKLLKKIFINKKIQWCFSRLHPNFAVNLAHGSSQKSRKYNCFGQAPESLENELLVLYSKEILKKEHFDYFIFGHRHLPMKYKLTEKSLYINTGDWLTNYSYTYFDGNKMELKFLFEDKT